MMFAATCRRWAGLVTLVFGGFSVGQAQVAPAVASLATSPLETLTPGAATNFRLFPSAFYANQLFLLGEAHGVAKPQEVDFDLLRHLNERAGVRYYLAEVDAAKAFFLNEYLRTGQDSTLRRVFASWVATNAQWANQDFLNKIKKIRTLNATLPARRQIHFLGIDEMQDATLVAAGLRALLPPAAPAGVRQAIDSVAALLGQPLTSRLAATARRASAALAQAHHTVPAATYDELTAILAEATDYPSRQGREVALFTNFERLLQTKRLRHEKLYGMWGLYHVLQRPLLNGGAAFAAQVRASSLPLHHKVASVLCVFAGCQMLYPTAALPAPLQAAGQRYTVTSMFNHDGPLVTINGLAALKARTAPTSLTLLPLAGPQALAVRYAPGLPADQQLRFNPQVPACDYVQYLVLVRGSGAVTPLAAVPGEGGAAE
ncbi:MAG: hypothetical protein ACRYFX_19160 [Janthinobacterium lividum]